MTKPNKKIKKYQLAFLFAVCIFVLLVATMAFMFLGILLLVRWGFTDTELTKAPLIIFAIFSVLVGTIFAMVFSKIPLAPMREIIAAIDKLAEGDFSARLHLKGPYEIKNLNNRFNHMAKELGSIEMLRTDFINNFSHEFKTPIVSVRGFAKILKYEDLTKEERDDYLDIIINESERLAELSTNILNLSKIETQSIITDRIRYNVSEQIRRIIALLEPRWMKKMLTIRFDCDEIELCGNIDLLNQVWTNLIDNAIKFSPEQSVITVLIQNNENSVTVIVSDQGVGMNDETAQHLFDKFYQGDTSHSTKGNGIGLTLVKKIVELHEGTISVQHHDTGTAFEVELPIEMEHEHKK